MIPNPRPAPSRWALRQPIVGVENPVECLALNASAGILDLEDERDACATRIAVHQHAQGDTAPRGVFDRVHHQIDEDLLKSKGVAQQTARDVRGDGEVECDTGGRGPVAHDGDDGLHDVGQPQPLG